MKRSKAVIPDKEKRGRRDTAERKKTPKKLGELWQKGSIAIVMLKEKSIKYQ